MTTILWRRLDAPGHDACRLLKIGDGWRLDGKAVYRESDTTACLSYEIEGDDRWQTRRGVMLGWVGERQVEFRITRAADGAWTFNGSLVPGLEPWVDLDLGFTPSTNLFQLRRMALEVGQSADVSVAWLDVTAGTLDTLHQRYERRSADSYWYEAPRFEYSALLRVNSAGFVERYPEFWEAESSGS
jgi:hypothetical protein